MCFAGIQVIVQVSCTIKRVNGSHIDFHGAWHLHNLFVKEVKMEGKETPYIEPPVLSMGG